MFILNTFLLFIYVGVKDRRGKVQAFGKDELNHILKFGAQDLFKVCWEKSSKHIADKKGKNIKKI